MLGGGSEDAGGDQDMLGGIMRCWGDQEVLGGIRTGWGHQEVLGDRQDMLGGIRTGWRIRRCWGGSGASHRGTPTLPSPGPSSGTV